MKLIRKEYTTPEEKKKDFWRGFGLWWAINVFMLAVLVASSVAISNWYTPAYGTNPGFVQGLWVVCNLLPWLVNIGLLVFLTLTRSQMALGALAAFGVAAAVAVLLGVFATLACFVLLASYGN